MNLNELKTICDQEKRICSMALAISQVLKYSAESDKKEFYPAVELLSVDIMDQYEKLFKLLEDEKTASRPDVKIPD